MKQFQIQLKLGCQADRFNCNLLSYYKYIYNIGLLGAKNIDISILEKKIQI